MGSFTVSDIQLWLTLQTCICYAKRSLWLSVDLPSPLFSLASSASLIVPSVPPPFAKEKAGAKMELCLTLLQSWLAGKSSRLYPKWAGESAAWLGPALTNARASGG